MVPKAISVKVTNPCHSENEVDLMFWITFSPYLMGIYQSFLHFQYVLGGGKVLRVNVRTNDGFSCDDLSRCTLASLRLHQLLQTLVPIGFRLYSFLLHIPCPTFGYENLGQQLRSIFPKSEFLTYFHDLQIK